MNILEEIVANKRKEVDNWKQLFPIKLLEQSLYFKTDPLSLTKYLLREDKSGIIAEIKRKSPSKGVINPEVSVERISIGYMQAGASALSVLTDSHYFGGKNEDLLVARKFNFCPILRKDFTVDEYQILEAKSIGADAILLIAAVLSAAEVKQLSAFAQNLGLEVILEVHGESELDRLCDTVNIVGVNNRDLTTFEVSLENSVKLASSIPSDIVKISESGINSAEDIIHLKKHGFNGFLIGERFMRNSRPEKSCARLIEKLEELESLSHA